MLISSLTSSAQQTRQTENVFLITLDGLRWQELFKGADSLLLNDKQYVRDPEDLRTRFWKPDPVQRRMTLMPFFWRVIAKEGQLYGNRDLGSKVNCSNQHWFSYPGYSEILCGFADDQRINSNDKIPNPNITVLEYINRFPQFEGSVAAFGSWDVFPYIINEKRSGVPVNAGFESTSAAAELSERELLLGELQSQIPSPWSTVRFDAFTYHYAVEYLKKYQPRVVYIAFGETDDFAHEGHYDAYLKSARQTDAFIEELWQYLQNHATYRNKTSLVITTDHGRGTIPKDSWRSHGIDVKGADQIWVAVMGPDTPSMGMIDKQTQYYQNQIAATVANLLGVEYTGSGKAGQAIPSILGPGVKR